MPMPVKHRKQTGFSLIELVLFIVIVGVSLGGIILAVNQSVSRSADPMIAIRAVELGQAYLDEILPKFEADSSMATRKASGMVLGAAMPKMPLSAFPCPRK